MEDKVRWRLVLAVLVLCAFSSQISTPADTSIPSSEALSEVHQKTKYFEDELIISGKFSTTTSQLNFLGNLVTVLTEHNIGDCYVNFHTPKPVLEAPSPGLWYSEDFLLSILNVRTKKRWRFTKKARMLLLGILVLKFCIPTLKRALGRVKQVITGVSDSCGWLRTNCAGIKGQLETLRLTSVVMSALLLLRSGDVEQNPGPEFKEQNAGLSESNNENQISLAKEMQLIEINKWISTEKQLENNNNANDFLEDKLRDTEPADPIPPDDIPKHLSHFDLCQFSYLAYKDFGQIDGNKIWETLKANWCVLLRAEHSDGYRGTLFWNKDTRQLVVAHKGTKLKRDWATNFLCVGCKQIRLQVIAVSTFLQIVKNAATTVNEENRGKNILPIQIYITGHSLGAYLAQVSTFTAKFLKITSDGSELIGDSDLFYPTTVGFDGPGARGIVEKIMDMINKNRHQLNISSPYHVDITMYLADPNVINKRQTQIGKLLLFTYPDDTFIELGHSIDDFMLVMYYMEEHHDRFLGNVLEEKYKENYPDTLIDRFFRTFISFVKSNLDTNKLKNKMHSIKFVNSWSKIKEIKKHLKPYENKSFSKTDLSQTEDTIETYFKLLGIEAMKNIYKGVEKYLPYLCDPSEFTDTCKGETRKKFIPKLRYCISKYKITLNDLGLHISNQGHFADFVDKFISTSFLEQHNFPNIRFSEEIYNSLMLEDKILSIVQTNIKSEVFYEHVKRFYEEKNEQRVYILPLKNTQLIKDLLIKIHHSAIIILHMEKSDNEFEFRKIDSIIKRFNKLNVRFLIFIDSQYIRENLFESNVISLSDIKYGNVENKEELLNWMEPKLNKLYIDLKTFETSELDSIPLQDFFELDSIDIRDHSSEVLISDDVYIDQALLFPVLDKSVRHELEEEKAKVVNIKLSDEINENDILIYKTENNEFLISYGQTSQPKIHDIFRNLFTNIVDKNQNLVTVKNTSKAESLEVANHLLKLYIKQNNAIIIQGVAGHGKSCFLSRIRGRHYGEHFKNKCVFFLKLNDICSQLHELDKKTNEEETEIIFEFLKLCVNLPWTELVKNIVKHHLQNQNMVLMLDGYDEIYSKYRKVVNHIIGDAKKAGVQIWITSRREYVEELEMLYKTKAFLLENFSREMQKEYFVKYWTFFNENNEDDTFYKDKSERLMEKMVYSKESSDDFSKFCGIPLQAKMLATIALRNNFEIEETNTFAQIYETFIETKYDIFFEQKAHFESTNSISYGLSEKMKVSFNCVHELLSILTLKFDKDDVADIGYVQWWKNMCIKSRANVNIDHDNNLKFAQQNFDETMMNIIRNIGVVEIHCNDEGDTLYFNFLHRTYAEFFYAKYLVRNLCTSYSVNSIETERVCTFIKEVYDVLSDERLKVIHTFIDILLADANIFPKRDNYSGVEFPSGVSVDSEIASCISQVFFPDRFDTENNLESTEKNIKFGSESAMRCKQILTIFLENKCENLFLFLMYALPDLVIGPFYWCFVSSDGFFYAKDIHENTINNQNLKVLTYNSESSDNKLLKGIVINNENYHFSLLHQAVKNNCQKVVVGLLSLLTKNKESKTTEIQKENIKQLISCTQPFDFFHTRGYNDTATPIIVKDASALHVAVYYGHMDMIQLLLKITGTDIITQTSPVSQNNVFHFAVKGSGEQKSEVQSYWYSEIVKYCVSHINGKENLNTGDKKMLRALLTTKDNHGRCPLEVAFVLPERVDNMIKELIEHYIKLEYSEGEDTLLHMLFSYGEIKLIHFILQDYTNIFNSQINIKNSKRELPCHVLFSKVYETSCQIRDEPKINLIESIFNNIDSSVLKEVNNDKQTILMCLAKIRMKSEIRHHEFKDDPEKALPELLKVQQIKESINCRDKNGMTALMHACKLDRRYDYFVFKYVIELLNAGAHVDIQDNFGNIAAMYAIMSKNFLLKDLKNNELLKLIGYNNPDLCKDLMQLQNNYKWTFLHCLYYGANLLTAHHQNDDVKIFYPTDNKIDLIEHIEKNIKHIHVIDKNILDQFHTGNISQKWEESKIREKADREQLAKLIIDKIVQLGIEKVLSLQDENQMTPLMFACWFGDLDTVKLLVRHMSVEQVRKTRDKKNNTALNYAEKSPDGETVIFLKDYVESGNINAIDTPVPGPSPCAIS